MISLAKCILVLSAVNAQSFTPPAEAEKHQLAGFPFPMKAAVSRLFAEPNEEAEPISPDGKAFLVCGKLDSEKPFEGAATKKENPESFSALGRVSNKNMGLLLGLNLAKSLALYPLDTLRIQAMNQVPRGSGNLFGGAGLLVPVFMVSDVLVNRLYVEIRNHLKSGSIKGANLLTSVATTSFSRVISIPFANIKRILVVKNLSILAASQHTLANNAYVGFIPALSASLLGMAVYDTLYEIGKERLQVKPDEVVKNALLGLGTALVALAGSYPLVWLQNEIAAGSSDNFVQIFQKLVKKDPLIVPTLFRGFGKAALLIAVEGVVVSINRGVFDEQKPEFEDF